MTWTSTPAWRANRSTRCTTDALLVTCSHLERREAPSTIWVIWLSLANCTSAGAGSSATISCQLAPRSSARCLTAASASLDAGRELSSPTTWTTCRSACTRTAIRAARRSTASVPGAALTATMMRSAVSQTMSGCRATRYSEQLLLGLVRDETERELAQRHEVLVAEEAVEGAGDLLGRVDVAVQHAPAQLLGGRVDQLELVGPAHDPVGHPLADGDAGDLLHGVGDAFEVLDVDRADDADTGVEDLEHVLPSLGVGPRTRHVRVGELVDEGDLGLAGEDRREVHLLEGRAPVVDDLARHDRQVADLLSGVGPAVRLDEADHHVGAALVATPALVEHGPGLADAGHGPEVDAELAGRLDGLVGAFLVSACSESALTVDPTLVRPSGAVPVRTLPRAVPGRLRTSMRAGHERRSGDSAARQGDVEARQGSAGQLMPSMLGEGLVQLEDVDVVRAEETELGGLVSRAMRLSSTFGDSPVALDTIGTWA